MEIPTEIKITISKPPAHIHSLYKNAYTTTKKKSYFINLVDRTIEQVLLYNFKYIAA